MVSIDGRSRAGRVPTADVDRRGGVRAAAARPGRRAPKLPGDVAERLPGNRARFDGVMLQRAARASPGAALSHVPLRTLSTIPPSNSAARLPTRCRPRNDERAALVTSHDSFSGISTALVLAMGPCFSDHFGSAAPAAAVIRQRPRGKCVRPAAEQSARRAWRGHQADCRTSRRALEASGVD